MDTQGTHLLIEYHGCDCYVLNDIARIESVLRKAAAAAGTTVVGAAFHQYKPVGVSGILLVAESHLSIHTWPEAGYAAVDIYTCGSCDSIKAKDVMQIELQAERSELMTIERGKNILNTKSSMTKNMNEANNFSKQAGACLQNS